MEIPARIPSRALVVSAAIASPSGTEKVTTTDSGPTSPSAARIIRLGTGLIARAPSASPSPGLVMVPTPSPARRMLSSLASAQSTSAVMRAPSVQSGSSPASFTTATEAQVRGPTTAKPFPASDDGAHLGLLGNLESAHT